VILGVKAGNRYHKMKNKFFGICLMLLAIVVGAYLSLSIIVTKLWPVLFGCVIPYFAGKIIYAQGGESNGVFRDAIAGFRGLFRSGQKVADTVKEEFNKA
jgi:hypothetical protein